MKCKTVTLRKRKIKNGTQYSLCLDYYPGYRDNATMKVITREALGIYIFAKPANQQEKDFNARMMKKAAILRNQRYEAIFNENHGFFDKNRMKGDFLAYFKELANKKNIKWQHVYKHFERFVDGKCTFDEVDVDLCRKFMEYLLDAPQSIHTNRKLHINSAAGYWSTFRAVLHTAYRDRKIKENPNPFLDRIECIPTIKEHLSEDELIRLAETPCEEDVLRRVFLFGCLTGIRKSDIIQLTLPMYMGEIGHNTDEWQEAFCIAMEQSNIGYTFWPYKKIRNSCFNGITPPENWDKVMMFSEAPRATYSEAREARPDQAVTRQAMLDFIEACKFENCTPQEGYINSLRLNK